MRYTNNLKLAFALVALLNATSAFAATCTWVGISGANWSNSANWDTASGGCSGGPNTARNDDLVFPENTANRNLTYDLGSLTSVNSITINGCGYSMTSALPAPLNIAGAVPITANCDVTANGAVNSISFELNLTFAGQKEIRNNTVGNLPFQEVGLYVGSLSKKLRWNNRLTFKQTQSIATQYPFLQISLAETTSGDVNNELVIDGGVVYFQDANPYAGLTLVKKGRLRVGNAGSLGASGTAANGTVVKTGGQLDKEVNTLSNEILTLDDDSNAPGVRGPVLFSGNVIGGSWNGPIVLTGVLNGTLAPEAEIEIQTEVQLFVGGVISGNADLLLSGLGQFADITPQQASTYAGKTTIGPDVRLIIGASSEVLPNTSPINIATGGEFWLNANSPNVTETIAGLEGTGLVRLNNGGAAGQSQLVLDLPPGKAFNYGGAINDVSAAGNKLALNVMGSGTQILAGNTTYSGATNVTGTATLELRGLNNSEVRMGANAVLRSTALASAGAIVPLAGASNARIRPGSAGGFGVLRTVNSGGLVFSPVVTPEFDIAGTSAGVSYDQLYSEGLVINVGNTPFAPNFITHLNPGEVVRLLDNQTGSALVGTFLNVAQNSYVPVGAGPKYQASYTGGTGNDFTLTRIAPVSNVSGAISGVIGQSLSTPALAPTGGVLPYTLSINGAPAWLSGTQSGNTLVLSGTVGAPTGTQNFTLNVIDAAGQTGSFPLTITVSAAGTDYSWNGSVDTNWATPGNWTPAGPPTTGAIVRFPVSAVAKTINAIPLGSFDFFELTESYTLNGAALVTLTNGNPVRFSGAITDLTRLSLPLLLSAPNALVSVNAIGNAKPDLSLGNVSQSLNFSGNINFELSNVPIGSGRGAVSPYFAAATQSGTVGYTASSGSGHLVVLRNATNYLGATTITGPGLEVEVNTTAPFGDTGAVTDTTLTDAIIRVVNSSIVPGNSFVIDHERLITNQPLSGSLTQLRSQHSIASTVVEWRGPVVANGVNVLVGSIFGAGTLRFNGVISGGANVRTNEGTVVFDGANTFTGYLEITAPAQVQTSANERIADGVIVYFNGPGVLNLAGNRETVNTINGPGVIQIGNGGVNGQLTIVASTATFNGTISDVPSGGAFRQTGGTLTFTGNASNTLPFLLQGGNFGLNGGTLPQVRMDGGNLVATGPATVTNFLPASGASTGGLLLAANTLNVNGVLGLASGITLTSIIDSDGPGRTVATGAATLAGAALNLSPSGAPINIGGSYDLIDAASLTGTFAGKPDNTIVNVFGQFYRVNYTATKVVITRVAPPAIVTVNTLGDGSSSAVCTLRKAVEAGNNPGVAPLNSSCGAVAANPIIQFDPSFLSIPNATILLSGGEILISKDMTISNIAARTLKIDASNNTRIFRIDNAAASVINVTLEGLNLVNGRASFDAVESVTPGGAIFTKENLSLFGMRFEGNQAIGSAPVGGAVAAVAGTPLTLIVEDSLFVSNAVSSVVAGSPVLGGAVFAAPGSLSVANSTFTLNSAVSTATAVTNKPQAYGGALFINASTATLNLNSFVGNTTSAASLTSGAVESSGAGVFAAAATVQINSSMFSANQSLTTGTARVGFSDLDFGLGGSVAAAYSLILNAPATVSQTNAITGAPLLSPLANNGGDTDTIGFQSGSSLKNAGDPALSLPPFDQRGPGFVRNVGVVDVGAYEQALSVSPINGVLAAGTVATVYAGASVAASGGVAPYSYIASGLPPGLAINLTTGAITGTPTNSVGSPFLVVVTATDSTLPRAQTIVANYSIAIAAAPVQVNLSATNASVLEGNSGPVTLNFTLTLSPAALVPVDVIVNTGLSAGALAADSADFTALSSQTVTFSVGETAKTVSVTVLPENIVEGNETFQLLLSDPAMPTATILTPSVLGTITNDDSAVLSVNSPSLNEGNSGTTPMNFTLSLSNPVQGTVTVNYAAIDGTATLANSDYAASSGSAVFPSLGQTAIRSVQIIGDSVFEADESFSFGVSALNLPSGVTAVTLAPATGTGTILNDDLAAITVTLAPALPTLVFSSGVSYPVSVTISASVRPTGSAQVTAVRQGLPSIAAISCTPSLSNGGPTNLVGSCNLSPPTPGVWLTTVSFTGTGGFGNANTSGNAILTATLAPITVLQSPATTVIGQPFSVSLTAAVSNGGPIPSGNVSVTQFPVGPPNTGPLVGGQITFNLTALSPVVKALRVVYTDPSGVYSVPEQFVSHTTTAAPTGLSSSLSATAGAVNQPVLVSYTLGILPPGAQVATPTGDIRVSDGVTSATCVLVYPTGSCALSPATFGARQIVATYLGDASYVASVAPAQSYQVQQGNGTVDLAAVLRNGVRVINGTQSVYTLVITNTGSAPVSGALVQNALPTNALAQSYTCSASAGSTCAQASGNGAISQVLDVAISGSVSFSTVVTLPSVEAVITNVASVSAPVGIVDANPANNVSTDTDALGIFGTGFESEVE
jgi:uncharacterized repeat protein (TIGR01451 family)